MMINKWFFCLKKIIHSLFSYKKNRQKTANPSIRMDNYNEIFIRLSTFSFFFVSYQFIHTHTRRHQLLSMTTTLVIFFTSRSSIQNTFIFLIYNYLPCFFSKKNERKKNSNLLGGHYRHH